MYDRCEKEADRGQENNAAKDCVSANEELAGFRRDRPQRTHAGKNHRSVSKRIDPPEFFKAMVTEHANTEIEQEHGSSDSGVLGYARQKLFSGQ